MRLLLDTRVALALLRRTFAQQYPDIARRLDDPSTVGFVSVASLWEIAIKTRLGKLDPGMPLQDFTGYLDAVDLSILPLKSSFAAARPFESTLDFVLVMFSYLPLLRKG
jgi:PIN domain nuclease of toxin-antitoxin system